MSLLSGFEHIVRENEPLAPYTRLNIGGAADGSDNGTVTISGQILTISSSSAAEGLQMFYDGAGNESAISLNFTNGIATVTVSNDFAEGPVVMTVTENDSGQSRSGTLVA